MPSNVSGFSIFRREVRIRFGSAVATWVALATPSATSCTRSRVVIVGAGFLGGDSEQGCRKGGRGGSEGGPDGGPAADPGGVEGGFPPCPVTGPKVGGLGDTWLLSCSSRCLISGVMGTAGGLCRRSVGPGFRHSGLPSTGSEWADGALVLICLTGLLHAGGAVGTGGVVGNGIRVAMCWISALASWSWFSRVATRFWCSAAHNSTLPWKLARCWFRAVLASARKDRVSFTRAS